MDKTLQEKVELGLRVSHKMIDDMEKKLQEAISREDWKRAGDLKSYIDGMKQIEVVFDQAVQGSSADGKDRIIEEMKTEIKSLRGKVSALQSFGSAAVCKSCGEWYPNGYVCSCGRDNSYSDEEWANMQAVQP